MSGNRPIGERILHSIDKAITSIEATAQDVILPLTGTLIGGIVVSFLKHFIFDAGSGEPYKLLQPATFVGAAIGLVGGFIALGMALDSPNSRNH